EVREAMGADLDQDAIDALQQQVEGWPVAVQMTRLLGNDNSKNRGSRGDIVGSHGHVANYLVTNVLRSQPDELQEFLLETSILKAFNTDLADTVCGDDESRSLIRQLEPLQALVIPLDDEHQWIRYHHLFAECLKDLLKHNDPDRFAELHRRAAKWCSENRLIVEAVDYANAIQDYDLSRQIINDNCEWMRAENFGGVGYVNALFANIPEEEIAKDVRILFSKALACMLNGDLRNAVRYQDMAESLIERDGLTLETLGDRLGIGTGILARTEFGAERGGGWLNARLETAEALTKDHPEALYLCGAIRTSLAGQSMSYGEFDKAREHALAEINSMHIMTPVVARYILVTRGVVELWTNRLEEARRCFNEATAIAVEFGGDRSDMAFICEVFLKAIDYWRSDIDTEPPLRLEQALMHTVEAEGWFDVYSVGFDAVVHDAICRQDFDKADELIARLEEATDRLVIARLNKLTQLLRLDCTAASNDFALAAPIFEKVKNWLDAGERERDDLGWFVRNSADYTCAHYLGAIGQYEEALAHVERGLADVDPLDVILFRVRGRILKAALLERMQRQGEAVETLTHAIEDAARIGCTRPFARDVSPALVREAAREAGGKDANPTTRAFVDRLSSPYSKELFTVREQEVLQGLADGKANKEIARDLDLTDNTVKFHVRNIYRKLNVTKRVKAVQKARELGVLS
ncbi:MAG: LuxR C-terminal-related transcriptional regulator, partial [Pseudomonadota bacterium]